MEQKSQEKHGSCSSGSLEADRVHSGQAVVSVPRAEGSVPEGWDHKDRWCKRGRDFLVEVSRHSGTPDPYNLGPHRWCVYAYVYPKHPCFADFDGPRMWQDAATRMPFHGGPSLLEYPMYEGKVTSVKVGADYSHLHDEHFTNYATPVEAWEVFDDAEALHRWLSERAALPAPAASGAFPEGAPTVSPARQGAEPNETDPKVIQIANTRNGEEQ